MHLKDGAPHLFRRASWVLVLVGLESLPIVQWRAQTFPTRENERRFRFVGYGVPKPLVNHFVYGQ
ncbi:hypothetical protein EBZ80_27885 [bacterium]|nr:hypothetical protein [bacterium]